jgi:hypothetical protein
MKQVASKTMTLLKLSEAVLYHSWSNLDNLLLNFLMVTIVMQVFVSLLTAPAHLR